ncbi:MAG: transglutaminase [Mesorhizobium sp.]|nr:MAG: transglutaminase [Mesorhizobium sp.]
MQLSAWGTASAGPLFMHTGGRTTQPVGHYELCQRIPIECNERTPNGSPVELTRKLWATMIKVNNSVNTRVKPRTDMEIYGVEEYWAYPDNGFGDCEDFALEKRRELMAAGVPAGDLLMTVVRQPNGDGHAVLTVRTNEGDLVLDNLTSAVRDWSSTPYNYFARQAQGNGRRWERIGAAKSVGTTATGI